MDATVFLLSRPVMIRSVSACNLLSAVNLLLQAVIANPLLEEEHGRIMARAALKAGVECYVWSTLPSSQELTKGEVKARIYDCEHSNDCTSGTTARLIQQQQRTLLMGTYKS